MEVVTFTEKRPPDIRAVKWRGNPNECFSFANLWPDAEGFSFNFSGQSLTVNRPNGLSFILLRGTMVEVEPVVDRGCVTDELRAIRILSTIDLNGYVRK